jgi:uncharacterized membrane protein
MVKERFKNYAMWASLASQVALLIQLVALLVGAPIADDIINGWLGVVDIILGLLATLGIISNPTKPGAKGFNL